eukprot:GSA120T00023660001.1
MSSTSSSSRSDYSTRSTSSSAMTERLFLSPDDNPNELTLDKLFSNFHGPEYSFLTRGFILYSFFLCGVVAPLVHILYVLIVSGVLVLRFQGLDILAVDEGLKLDDRRVLVIEKHTSGPSVLCAVEVHATSRQEPVVRLVVGRLVTSQRTSQTGSSIFSYDKADDVEEKLPSALTSAEKSKTTTDDAVVVSTSSSSSSSSFSSASNSSPESSTGAEQTKDQLHKGSTVVRILENNRPGTPTPSNCSIVVLPQMGSGCDVVKDDEITPSCNIGNRFRAPEQVDKTLHNSHSRVHSTADSVSILSVRSRRPDGFEDPDRRLTRTSCNTLSGTTNDRMKS